MGTKKTKQRNKTVIFKEKKEFCKKGKVVMVYYMISLRIVFISS